MIQTKVCIVGAGPAGASLSHFLSKEKIDHVLVDKASFPRDKVCGDGLTVDVLNTLKRIDPNLLQKFLKSEDVYPCKGFCFHGPTGKDMRYDFAHSEHGNAIFYTARRVHLDQFLIENLPEEFVQFLPEHKVTGIERLDSGFSVDLEGAVEKKILCDFVIGAEGEKPIVTRYLGLTHFRKKEHLMGALRVYYKGVEGFHENNHLELFFDKELLPGYFWVFPLSNGEANVGVIMDSTDISKRKINLKKKLDYMLKHHPKVSEMFKNAEPLEKPVGWGLPSMTPERKIAGEGYALIGDAAGMIEPLTGKGIGPGMVSGRLLSGHIKQAILENRTNLDSYQTHVNRYYEWERRAMKVMHKVVNKPSTFSLMQHITEFKPIHNKLHSKIAKEWQRWL